MLAQGSPISDSQVGFASTGTGQDDLQRTLSPVWPGLCCSDGTVGANRKLFLRGGQGGDIKANREQDGTKESSGDDRAELKTCTQ